MSECQLLNDGWSENFAPKLVAMATSLEGWKKEGQINNRRPSLPSGLKKLYNALYYIKAGNCLSIPDTILLFMSTG